MPRNSESQIRLELAFLLAAFVATSGYLVARYAVTDAPVPGADGSTSALYQIAKGGAHAP